MKKTWRSIISGFSNSHLFEKIFVILAMCAGFCITLDASIVKPVSNSFFISSYGTSLFPYAWLFALPINLLVVTIYNKFLAKAGCFKVMWTTVAMIIFGGILSASCIATVSWIPFVLYIWKDIYILLMFQQLWSVIHVTIPEKQSKWCYGLLFGFGGLGSVAGSFISGHFSLQLGSQKLLLYSIPVYVAFGLIYSAALYVRNKMGNREDLHILRQDCSEKKLLDGFQLVRNSRQLRFILAIVVCMQVAATLMELQFSLFLKQIPSTDQMTAFSGKLFTFINGMVLFLQFFGSTLLLNIFKLRTIHFSMPVIFLGNAFLFLLFPQFGMFIYTFAIVKSFDYSIFNIAKESLYSPLAIREKFQAKAVIDVFAYRSARGIASILVLLLQGLSFAQLSYLSIGNILVFLSWILSVVFFYREKQKPVLSLRNEDAAS